MSIDQIDWQSFALGAAAGAAVTMAIRVSINLLSSTRHSVHQQDIDAGGDVVGGDKTETKK